MQPNLFEHHIFNSWFFDLFEHHICLITGPLKIITISTWFWIHLLKLAITMLYFLQSSILVAKQKSEFFCHTWLVRIVTGYNHTFMATVNVELFNRKRNVQLNWCFSFVLISVDQWKPNQMLSLGAIGQSKRVIILS